MRNPIILLTTLSFVLASPCAPAQHPGFSTGMPGPKLMVLMLPEAKKELKLTKEQDKKLDTMVQNLKPDFAGLTPGKSLFDGIDREIGTILDEKQHARLVELWIQREGAFVLLLDEIADRLELAADQKSKLSEIAGAYSGKLMEAMQKGLRSRADVKKIQDMQAEHEKQMIALLTEAQAAKFEQMKGKKFTFKY